MNLYSKDDSDADKEMQPLPTTKTQKPTEKNSKKRVVDSEEDEVLKEDTAP